MSGHHHLRKPSDDTAFVHATGLKKREHRISVVVAKAIHKVRRIFFAKRAGPGHGGGAGALTGPSTALVVTKRPRCASSALRRASGHSNNTGGDGGSQRENCGGGGGGGSSNARSYRSTSLRRRPSIGRHQQRSFSRRGAYNSTKIYSRLSQLSSQVSPNASMRQQPPDPINSTKDTPLAAAATTPVSTAEETPQPPVKYLPNRPLRYHRASSYIECMFIPTDLSTRGRHEKKGASSQLHLWKEETDEAVNKEQEDSEEEEEELEENHTRVPGWSHSIRIEEPFPDSVKVYASRSKKAGATNTTSPEDITSVTEEGAKYEHGEDGNVPGTPTTAAAVVAQDSIGGAALHVDICKQPPLEQVFESIVKKGARSEVNPQDRELVINTYQNKYIADFGFSPNNIFEHEPDRKSNSCDTQMQEELLSQKTKSDENGDDVFQNEKRDEININIIPPSLVFPTGSGPPSGSSLVAKENTGNPVMYYFSEESGSFRRRRSGNSSSNGSPVRNTSISSYSSTSSTQNFQSTKSALQATENKPLKSCIKKPVSRQASDTKQRVPTAPDQEYPEAEDDVDWEEDPGEHDSCSLDEKGLSSTVRTSASTKRVRFLIDIEAANKKDILTPLVRRNNVNTSLFVHQHPKPSLGRATTSIHKPRYTTVSEAVAAAATSYAFQHAVETAQHAEKQSRAAERPVNTSVHRNGSSASSGSLSSHSTSPSIYSSAGSPLFSPASSSPPILSGLSPKPSAVFQLGSYTHANPADNHNTAAIQIPNGQSPRPRAFPALSPSSSSSLFGGPVPLPPPQQQLWPKIGAAEIGIHASSRVLGLGALGLGRVPRPHASNFRE